MKKEKRIIIDSAALNLDCAQLVGYDSIQKPIELPSHLHSGFEIVFLEKGDTVFELGDNKRIYVRGGNFSIIHPNTMHKGEWEIIKPCSLFWIVYDLKSGMTGNGILGQKLLKKICTAFRDAGNMVFPGNEYLRRQFRMLLDVMVRYTADRKNETAIAQVRLQLLHILVSLYEVLTQYEPLTHQLPGISDKHLPIEEIEAYIHSKIDDKIEVHDLAEICRLSVSVFQSRFMIQTGLSPGDYITRIRVEKAKQMLPDPGCSITGLALDLGFSSSQYFSTIFKKYTGMTPTVFRKKTANT